ncbi:hypothetical protein KXW55_004224, partial [Aspergillus fumigatus]
LNCPVARHAKNLASNPASTTWWPGLARLDDADISKYNSLIQRFVNVLEEEEQKRAGGLPMPSMATLMHESMKDGKFWFHELIYSCFESPDSRGWTAIRQLLPSTDELATVPSPEVDLFA